jgi:hypothetical protein
MADGVLHECLYFLGRVGIGWRGDGDQAQYDKSDDRKNATHFRTFNLGHENKYQRLFNEPLTPDDRRRFARCRAVTDRGKGSAAFTPHRADKPSTSSNRPSTHRGHTL